MPAVPITGSHKMALPKRGASPGKQRTLAIHIMLYSEVAITISPMFIIRVQPNPSTCHDQAVDLKTFNHTAAVTEEATSPILINLPRISFPEWNSRQIFAHARFP